MTGYRLSKKKLKETKKQLERVGWFYVIIFKLKN